VVGPRPRSTADIGGRKKKGGKAVLAHLFPTSKRKKGIERGGKRGEKAGRDAKTAYTE